MRRCSVPDAVSLVYRIMYMVGFTPWDTFEVPSELAGLIEGPDALPVGRALDIGCGTGTQAVYLANHGWNVTGVDSLSRPLRWAREKASAADVEVKWVKGDASRLDALGLEPGFTLLFDRGCYHGLSESERAAYALGATALAAPGATLLMMVFARNTVKVGPAGANADEIAAAFGDDWESVGSHPDSGAAPGGPLKNVPRHWYRLTRR